MPALPIISGAKAVKAFRKAHWVEVRRRGSHIILVKEGSQVTLSVPNHKELDRGTLHWNYTRLYKGVIFSKNVIKLILGVVWFCLI